MKKRGLSQVVSVLILVLLTISAAVVVWVAVKNLIEPSLEEAGTCFDAEKEITLNQAYTCYYNTNNIDYINFSISVGNVKDLNEIKVLVTKDGDMRSFVLDDNTNELYIKYKNNPSANPVMYPSPNSGKSYNLQVSGADGLFQDGPVLEGKYSIQISPVINEIQCGTSSSVLGITKC